jgi:hypothetical protein
MAGAQPQTNKNMKRKLLITLTLASALLPTALRAEETKKWTFDTSLNLFLAGLSGDVTVKGQPAKVDAGFGDILDHLKAGAAGRVTLGYDRWFLSTEFSYMKLVASVPAANVDIKQWLVEPSLGYQFCEYFAGFAGARYNNIDGTVNFTGPVGLVRGGTQEWWDPIIGAQLSYPLLGKKLTFDGHFDLGGFGVGSSLTWQAYPYLNWRFAKWGSAQLGYRWLGTDYQTGSGASKFRYDVVVQGPQIGFTFHF